MRAGSHHVSAAQGRAGVSDREDAMGPVAVVALGRRGVAQPGHLPVEGVEKGLSFVGVAAPALIHHQEAEIGPVGAADGVRRVAVLARRQLPIRINRAVPRPVDAGLELLLDAVVARPACSSDVVGVDRRLGVIRRQGPVSTVAARTGGGHHQTALEQPLAVDAHLVALDRRREVDVNPHGGLLALAMAAGTQVRDVSRVRPGGGQVPAGGRVLLVAVQAGGRVRVPLGRQPAVNTRSMLFHAPSVADTAVHRRPGRGAGPRQRGGHLCVALGAGGSGVGRSVVALLVHIQRDGVTLRDTGELRVAVARQAVCVGGSRLVVDPPDLVGRVTVHTGRDLVWLFLP